MIQEHGRAVLTVDLPEFDLKAGDGAAYELEIFSADGHTLDVVTVEATQVRAVSRRDVLHVRQLPV